MNVLITGISGFIGSNLAKWLVGHNHHVVGISRRHPKQQLSGVTYYEGSILNKNFMEEVSKSTHPDVIFHLAGPTDRGEIYGNPQFMFRIHTEGMFNVLDLAATTNARLIFASSGRVYGCQDRLPVTETDICATSDVLGMAKGMAENILIATKEVMSIHARIFNVYGPGQSDGFLVPTILEQVKIGRSEIELGNLNNVNDYLHVDDVSTALTCMMNKGFEQPGLRVFNVCSGVPETPLTIVSCIGELLHRKLAVVFSEDRAELSSTVLYGDNTRLMSLGWKPHMAFLNGLKTVIQERKVEIQPNTNGSDA